jgi:hypothetical protein
MNPSPEAQRPFNSPPRLIDCRTNPTTPFPAKLTRGYPIDYGLMLEVEKEWGPARSELATQMAATGERLESRHWYWPNKAVPSHYPAGWHCLVTVECEGQVQGIMAVETLLRPAVLDLNGWVVYVDFVESAPWNYRVPSDRNRPVVRAARFAGIGTLLIAEAVRMSMGQRANGRVGLHALPQADDFYMSRCGMRRIGEDPAYHNLVYFEYPDGVAAK